MERYMLQLANVPFFVWRVKLFEKSVVFYVLLWRTLVDNKTLIVGKQSYFSDKIHFHFHFSYLMNMEICICGKWWPSALQLFPQKKQKGFFFFFWITRDNYDENHFKKCINVVHMQGNVSLKPNCVPTRTKHSPEDLILDYKSYVGKQYFCVCLFCFCLVLMFFWARNIITYWKVIIRY